MDIKIKNLKEAMVEDLKGGESKLTVPGLIRSCHYNTEDFIEIAKHTDIVDLWADASLEARLQLENEANELTDQILDLEKKLESFQYKIPLPTFKNKKEHLEQELASKRNELELTNLAIGKSAIYYKDLLIPLKCFDESMNNKNKGALQNESANILV